MSKLLDDADAMLQYLKGLVNNESPTGEAKENKRILHHAKALVEKVEDMWWIIEE